MELLVEKEKIYIFNNCVLNKFFHKENNKIIKYLFKDKLY